MELSNWIAVGTLAGTIAMSFIGLKIQSLIQKIGSRMDQHDAVDDLKFRQIDTHFEYTDSRVDRLEQESRGDHAR